MPASSGPLRTYGKRLRVNRKESLDGQETSKRRKVSEDPVFRTPSPTRRTENDADTDTDVEDSSQPVKPTILRKYGTPSKLVRDLSGIFDSMSPLTPSSGMRSPAMTPTKLAKRMLGRSKTESSVESQSPSVKDPHHPQGNGIDRTSSLPNLPSSSSSPYLTPDRLSSNDNSTSTLSLSRPTIFPTTKSSSKGSTTRTYAGKYRSFLMALPASPSGSTSLSKAKGLTNEDEFETRESYSSLRSRWGVDNSEDDPHPSYDIASPSNSTTTTSEASPSRNGNGKGKAARTVPVPNGMMNPLKSISELRNKGESRRFLDEVGYLFEGLDPKCGIALRRSSALEISTKLCDPEFTRKAKATDFFRKTWELSLLAGAGKGEDKILDILLVFFLALVARDPVSLTELVERPTDNLSSSVPPSEDTSLVHILIRILDTVCSKGDLLALSDQNSRPSGGQDVERPAIPKKDRTILHSIVKVITSKSNLFAPCTPMSIPLLITSTLQTLPPSCLSVSCLPTLLNSLRRCLSPYPLISDTEAGASPSPTTLYNALSSESRWLDIVKYVPYESVYHHLKLVDAYLVGQWTGIGHGADLDRQTQEVEGHRFLDEARNEWMVRDLIALGVCCELNLREKRHEGEEGTPAHQKTLTLTLRVLISLTHNDKGWSTGVMGCEMTTGLILRTVWKAGREILCLTRDESVSEDDEDDEDEVGDGSRKAEKEKERDGGSHSFDTLCLVLGLLTNLVQVVDGAKDVVRRSHLDPSCALQNRACLKRCVCAQKPRRHKERENGKARSGVEVLVWLYEQLQLQREGGSQQSGGRHERTRLDKDKDLSERAREQEQENEAQSSFLRGNLAVLFGLLMMGKSGVENRRVIFGSGAPRHSSTATGSTSLSLTRLAAQAREFDAFYTVVSRRMTRIGHGYEEQGGRVVQHVVEFLEGLRDGVGT